MRYITGYIYLTVILIFFYFSIYFLSFSATDLEGEGKRNVVNLRITLRDENDNPPVFENKVRVLTIFPVYKY